MDSEVPYTTLERKWQFVRDHVRTGDLASHAIAPTENPPVPRPPEALVAE